MNNNAPAVRVLESGWGASFSPEAAALYLDGLSDLDPDVTLRAVRRLLRTEEFRPSIARVRREVLTERSLTVEVAVKQAEAFLRWRDASRFVNGSGYAPVRPEVDDRVVVACAGLQLVAGWRDKFLFVWRSSDLRELEHG